MKRILGILALTLALALAACADNSRRDDVISETKSHLDKAEQLTENDSLMESFAEYLEAAKTQELVDYKLNSEECHFLAVTYFNIGNCFSSLMENNEEIDAYNYSLRYAEAAHDTAVLHRVYTGMACAYDCVGSFDSANVYIAKAKSIIDSVNDIQDYLAVLYAESSVLYDQGFFDESTEVMQKMIAFKINNGMRATGDSISLGINLFFEGKHTESKQYLLKIIGSDIEEPMKSSVMSLLQTIYEEENSDSATYFQQHFPTYVEAESDRMSNITLITKMYDNYKAERDAFFAERKKQNVLKYVLFSVFALIVIVLAVLFIARKRRKENSDEEILMPTNPSDCIAKFAKCQVCVEIITSLHDKNIKRSATLHDYPELVLSDGQLQRLTDAVIEHFPRFDSELERRGVKRGSVLQNLCHLYLLGIDAKQAAILLSRDYSTIIRYEKKLKTMFQSDGSLHLSIEEIAVSNR